MAYWIRFGIAEAERGIEFLKEAASRASVSANDALLSDTTKGLGDLLYATGSNETAILWYRRAVEAYNRLGRPWLGAQITLTIGDVFVRLDRRDDAAAAFSESARLFSTGGRVRQQGAALLRKAELLLQRAESRPDAIVAFRAAADALLPETKRVPRAHS